MHFADFVDYLRDMREDRILEMRTKYSHIPEAFDIDVDSHHISMTPNGPKKFDVIDQLDNYLGDIRQDTKGKWKIRVAEHRGWNVAPRRVSQSFNTLSEAFTHFPEYIQHLN